MPGSSPNIANQQAMNKSNPAASIRWAFNSATIMHCPWEEELKLWEEELKLWEEFGWRAAEVWYAKMQPRLTAGASLNQLAEQMHSAGGVPHWCLRGFHLHLASAQR
jgi:hypothetical protein